MPGWRPGGRLRAATRLPNRSHRNGARAFGSEKQKDVFFDLVDLDGCIGHGRHSESVEPAWRRAPHRSPSSIVNVLWWHGHR